MNCGEGQIYLRRNELELSVPHPEYFFAASAVPDFFERAYAFDSLTLDTFDEGCLFGQTAMSCE
jgi:hypothetical protein